MNNTPAKADVTEWLDAKILGRPIGVDRENKIIRGYVVAQLGRFKSVGRGQFDEESLQIIENLYRQKPAGLKARFTHPDMSSDGLGKFLGRSKNAFRDGDKVRADLHLDQTSFNTPSGNLGGYIMDLAENDPDALSSSLVLQAEKIYQLDEDGRAKRDEKGDEIPPIWRPTKLHASDVVDTGDAVDGFLSFDIEQGELPDAAVRVVSGTIDRLFAGMPREIVEQRLRAFTDRYLSNRYGDPLPLRDYERIQRQREREAEILAKSS